MIFPNRLITVLGHKRKNTQRRKIGIEIQLKFGKFKLKLSN